MDNGPPSARKRLALWGGMALVALLLLECALQVFYLSLNGDFLFRRVVLPLYRPQPHRYYGMLPDLAYRHRTNEFSVTTTPTARGCAATQRRGRSPWTRRPAAIG